MKAAEYKAVKAEVLKYIEMGKPLTSARVMDYHEPYLSHRQYYELVDMIHKALEHSAE